MPIKVEHEEPDIPKYLGLESCCFCERRTPYWCEKDVAVCLTCAETHTIDEVPSKEAWCKAYDKKHKTAGRVV